MGCSSLRGQRRSAWLGYSLSVLLAEERKAAPLKAQARLVDLHLWQMEMVKTTKKGSKKYAYWMATWWEGDKVRNIHLG
jgi:hypothetical protein